MVRTRRPARGGSSPRSSAFAALLDLVDLGTVRQKNRKEVRAFYGEGELDVSAVVSNTFEIEWPPRSGRTQAFPEIDRAEWFPVDVAREKLNPAQAEFLDRLP